MRFIFPTKKDVGRVYDYLKDLHEEDFFGFISRVNQKIFCIKNEFFSSVVVIDSIDRRIDIFTSDMSLLTCHNMFAGNSTGVTAYGFSQYHIIELENSTLDEFSSKKYFNRYKFYEHDDKTICYFSAKPGQVPFICERVETASIELILYYLFVIKSLYEEGYEETNSEKDEMVASFIFNEDDETYSSSFEKLENFDFSPNIPIKPYKDKKYVEKLQKHEIKAGTLHVGMGYGNQIVDNYEFENDVFVNLHPIFLFAVNSEGEFDYLTYTSDFNKSSRNLKKQLLNLFDKVGLYDTVVTSNPFIYKILEKNLKALGIEVELDYDDKCIYFFLMNLFILNDSGSSFEEAELFLNKFI